MKPLEKYWQQMTALFEAQIAGNEPLEDAILNEMDLTWKAMTPDERASTQMAVKVDCPRDAP